jgi:hypothetical protein
MATLTVECRGGKWQDDYLTVAEQVDRYTQRAFGGWNDGDDRAAEARLILIQDFARQWQPGGRVHLQMHFATVDAKRGRTACSHARRRLLPLRTNHGGAVQRARARVARIPAEVDFRLVCCRLKPRDREIVELLVAGHTKKAIRRLRGHCSETVVAAARRCLALMEK